METALRAAFKSEAASATATFITWSLKDLAAIQGQISKDVRMMPKTPSGIKCDIIRATKRQTPATIITVIMPLIRLMDEDLSVLFNVLSHQLIRCPIATTG